ncbi:3-hydroxybenzoate 6-monooxygenase [Xanthomonas hyacinthi]|uniref:Salicylate hydroxylase n=1 Tax=Xanthomonas hyacinthi TaxID=56455 RepID=A0A2S7EY51_9XANT|nr:3-hydroxybenzoate 6-monooxygenase [Xanthomonas hyacinthi]KLD77780.1 salicylate hydroxylase [Xanthomonas hyacinthi DSM 19077]PPU98084.1 salicylate hydroxylase [Xanthomonas hyacinthi]QGY76878.1 3-hydroxybenzoate 6-monooxygenase [Xanthomonas hyacinthi]
MNDLPVLIIGGGIGGLATALALAQRQIPTVLVEQAREFLEIGAGIQLGPNGFRALRALGLDEEAMQLGIFPDELVFMDSVSGSRVTTIPTGKEFMERFEFPYTLIHRADLHAVLLAAARRDPLIELHTNVKVTSITEGASITLTTDSGCNFIGSALIGADGLWSKTRELVVADGAPMVSGHIAYRAVLPTADVPQEFRQNAMILWGGPKHHLVQYPLRGGELFNLVAVFHSDKYVEGWNTKGDAAELGRRFAGACDTVRALLSRIETWRMWVLCDREPVKNWTRGNITLVGDAAHPMLQYLAQGACMALEDAVALGQCVADKPSDLSAVFQDYQAQRYLRTGRCQVMARVHGEFYHADGVKAEMRNLMLAGRTPAQAYAGLDWLYQDAARAA